MAKLDQSWEQWIKTYNVCTVLAVRAEGESLDGSSSVVESGFVGVVQSDGIKQHNPARGATNGFTRRYQRLINTVNIETIGPIHEIQSIFYTV